MRKAWDIAAKLDLLQMPDCALFADMHLETTLLPLPEYAFCAVLHLNFSLLQLLDHALCAVSFRKVSWVMHRALHCSDLLGHAPSRSTSAMTCTQLPSLQ